MMPIFALTKKNFLIWFGFLPISIFNLCLRKIKNPTLRRWTVTIEESLVLYCVLGHEAFDIYFSIIIFAAYLKLIGPKHCHWLGVLPILGVQAYLRFGHFGISSLPDYYLKDCIYMKAVFLMCGVATDIHYSHVEIINKDNPKIRNSMHSRHDYLTNPTFMELVHFGLTFTTTGGSFHRYRTYDDFINLPFSRYSKPMKILLYKVPFALIAFTVYYKFHGEYFPEDYVFTEEFINRSLSYKLFYAITQHHAFRMWIMFNLIQYEVLYTAAGFGAYPVQGKNLPGHGPSENYEKLREMSEEECANAEYDFKTVNLFNFVPTYLSPWIIEIAKNWNCCIQYWLTSTGYRHAHNKSKFAKMIGMQVNLWLSCFWHGPEIGFVLSNIALMNLGGAQQYFWNIYNKTKGWVSVVFWIVQKISAEILIGLAIYAALLIEKDQVLYYLTITRWMPVIFAVAFNIISLIMCFIVNFLTKKPKNYNE